MPPFTLGQAAKATGRSKAGILDAIKSGRLSAARDDKNQWQIDPAELHRVYPLTVQLGVKTEQEQTPLNTRELRHLEEKIGLLDRIIGNLEDERDDLRQRLDKSEEAREAAAVETRRLTLMLTDQRQPQAEASQPKPAPPGVRLPFWFALVAVGTAAASWYLWPWVMGNH